jgi:hypothetical protein
MTKTTSRQYTLQDFNDIISAGFSYDFKDSNVIELISSLANKVGAPTYIKTPVFPKRDKPVIGGTGSVAIVGPNSSQDFSNTATATANRRPRNNKPSQITDDDWNMIRTFQKTEMKKTEGIEKRIDTIRSLLNKLTDSTYNAVEAEILAEVKDIIHSDDGGINEENITNITKIANSIFNTASTNTFYSALYSKLFKQLVNCHEIFSKVFEKSFSEFVGCFKKVEHVDPSVDYNKFCDNTKLNDKRKAMSMFIVNLMKETMLDSDSVVDIITELQEMVNSYIKQANKMNELEELNENIFILVTNGKDILSKHEKWESIISKIKFLSILKVKMKEYPSVNNKLIFKNMDILEELNLN